MPGWAQCINPTVSTEVATALKVWAGEMGLRHGTAAEVILWNALVRPTDARMAQGGFTDEQIERIYAEEVLAVLGNEQNPVTIAQTLVLTSELDADPSDNIKLIRKEIADWRYMRRIPRHYRAATFTMMARRGEVPRILSKQVVSEAWFECPAVMEDNDDSEIWT